MTLFKVPTFLFISTKAARRGWRTTNKGLEDGSPSGVGLGAQDFSDFFSDDMCASAVVLKRVFLMADALDASQIRALHV